MKWTEERILEEIKSLQISLYPNSDTMPTYADMKDNKLSGLGRAISLNGGIDKFRVKLGFSIKSKVIKWTDNEIEKQIRESMEILVIDRMPTQSEIKSIGNTALTSQLSRNGYYEWASRLGLKTKQSDTNKGKEYEKIATEKINEELHWLDVIPMSQNHPFDLKVGNHVKVDVKVGEVHNHFGSNSYTFRTSKKYGSCDFYICIGLEEGEVKDWFIIPSSSAEVVTLNISLGGSSKYEKFKNRWDLIDKMELSNSIALASVNLGGS